MKDAGRGESTQRKPWMAAVVIAGLAGGIAGAWVERVATGESHAGEAPAAAASDDALVRELRALVTELAAERQSAGIVASPDSPRSSASSAVPAPTALAPAADVQGALVALTEALAAFTQRLGAPGAQPIVVPPPDPARRKSVESFLDPSNGKAFSATRFWTAQKLIDAYGPPDTIHVENDSEVWIWNFPPQQTVMFTLHDGRVISMYAH